MCKPDAVERGLVGEIVTRLERKGLTLVAAAAHGRRAAGRGALRRARRQAVLRGARRFLTRSPVFAHGRRGAGRQRLSLVRKLVGTTKVDDAEPGTIRGDFATITTENLVHASDGHESAAREIALWFPTRSA